MRLNAEVARVSGFRDPALYGQRHDAFALSAVWRIRPQWEVGARMDRLKVAMPHDEHVDIGRLNEKALMVAWRPSHRQSLRLQLARQSQASGFEDPARRSVSLQYILAFGAHGAHAY